ncbi:DDB1- and CUL4-associated factor 4 isoform X2 [Mangifera indica]|uniref:DDB1- and CUL4-associated factor 4 isoform X2 n=1 Tax=Mangifera indica TaxID=29780 RepID=UPI001CFC0CC2|nr:DDB1- and CUL4-associated factor 4 isoform X2 [Mangifera indica]
MPQDLPGFYYDAEKNRYFPIKGPIPGTSRPRIPTTSTQNPLSNSTQPAKFSWTGERTSKLLQVRELNGNVLSLSKRKCKFMEEFQKKLASQPMVLKYQGTGHRADAALQPVRVKLYTTTGQKETDAVLVGSVNGTLSLFGVGKVGFGYGINFLPDLVWPQVKENKAESYKAAEHIGIREGASILMSSSLSSIKLPRKSSSCELDDDFNCRRAVVTTLGSETSGGAIYVLSLDDPFEFSSSSFSIGQRMTQVASFNCTIWTADCDSSASKAVVGTNLGAAMVNLETGSTSWVCRGKSDVFAQQLDDSGKVILCGLRNGAIMTVDVRERPQGSARRLIRHRIPYSPFRRTVKNTNKQWFELSGNICPARTAFMPSSISSLVSLHFYDQYFLASAMDGSVMLYDHRLTKRGPLQSYEGHANSHTRIQLAVDQSERFVMAGGEDCNLCIWSIKSGELLFQEKVSNSVPSTASWRLVERLSRKPDEEQSQNELQFAESLRWEAWFGSRDGLYHMHWP